MCTFTQAKRDQTSNQKALLAKTSSWSFFPMLTGLLLLLTLLTLGWHVDTLFQQGQNDALPAGITCSNTWLALYGILGLSTATIGLFRLLYQAPLSLRAMLLGMLCLASLFLYSLILYALLLFHGLI